MEKNIENYSEEEKEERSYLRLRTKFDNYVNSHDRKYESLKIKHEQTKIELAFYMFNVKLLNGGLTDKIKESFSKNNKNGGRLKFINSLIGENLAYESLPLEIKLIIKEMIENE